MENTQLLAQLIAQPGKVRPEHAPMLREALQKFPYAQPLHLLLARVEAGHVQKAALYTNGKALHNFLQFPTLEEEISYNEQQKQPAEVEQKPDLEQVEGNVAVSPNQEPVPFDPVATFDFFAFEEKENIQAAPQEPPHIETVVPDEPEINFVSKYDDDQLPYTFLWWLAKTRKEHEQVFQPYAHVNTVKAKTAEPAHADAKAFQQQYVEHIFHIQTPFEVADHLAEYPNADVKDAKGAEIIERFLKEDPTIKPPKPEQIDNENKAKKSAEDHYDLVSETLAKIYIEQMLYHKAIDTYKKLSLKYPEKSRYFADLVESIEKKL
ncbi:hypothetical protein ACJVDH_20685 [Pedobacter sp. AW1-32]|uniref:hypothetical protein n=1 Tax=Pedobacter sp. AW1-32 TaxID=3383026 RepID=UPI003FEF2776